ncbi:exo-beta-N-acetylmuramidase NamZ family protein [Lutimonas sp.]|uniref:exo-beta-N-acetylmuramidase NamZ family protein n=1 Tax=Lutimonas sp. TaxID=1872403 RepID=UPI003D9BE567
MKRLIRSKNTYLILVTELIVFLFIVGSFHGHSTENLDSILRDGRKEQLDSTQLRIVPAADLLNSYLPLLSDKNIAVVANQTSMVSRGWTLEKNQQTHLIDTLLSHNISISKVFAPEHGFRGKEDAGQKVANDKDVKTGLPILSLYGANKKPQKEQLEGIELVLFDIQDVGVRFYTYISTLSLVMEACAEQNIPLIVLDRPNPNGHYIDGPMLEAAHSSFVGMHEVPLVYGMTIGEYATMVNGEGWLKDSVTCDLTIIKSLNYSHERAYSLAVRPSPNLPNDHSINLYPSLGFFEGTIINAGRGTEFQFQRYGAPFFPKSDLVYIPEANFGSKHPKFKGEVCHGVDLSETDHLAAIDIGWLIDAYEKTPKDKSFFGKTFTIHAGNEQLQQQIEAGMSVDEIHKSWQAGIEKFKLIREQYLLYP